MKNETTLNMGLSKELKQKIERLAKERGLSVSAFIKMIFTQMDENK